MVGARQSLLAAADTFAAGGLMCLHHPRRDVELNHVAWGPGHHRLLPLLLLHTANTHAPPPEPLSPFFCCPPSFSCPAMATQSCLRQVRSAGKPRCEHCHTL